MQEALEALDKARSEMSDRQVKQGETHAASVEELQKQQDAAMRLLREEIGELQSSLAHMSEAKLRKHAVMNIRHCVILKLRGLTLTNFVQKCANPPCHKSLQLHIFEASMRHVVAYSEPSL